MSRLVWLWHRLYADFFLPSRLDSYHSLLSDALSLEYNVHTVSSFWRYLQSDRLDKKDKYLILRHDVDTDSSTAEAQWEIEKSLHVQATYFFRLSTIDFSLMRKLAQTGCEVSYHYEEIAALAKEKCLITREEVQSQMAHIRRRFMENLSFLRSRTNLPMKTVAAHGDFVNRYLNMPNQEILNESIRERMGIVLEVYDDEFNQHVSSRHIDCAYPEFWKPFDPLRAIHRGEHVVYIITHPRHWHTNRSENLSDNLQRILRGLAYAGCKLKKSVL